MKHLNLDTLSALVDGALGAADRDRAEAHMAACAECREALATLRAQDAALAGALVHDPGDAYFERFAERVDARIRADAAGASRPHGAQALDAVDASPSPRRRGWLGDLFGRRLAWAGGALVLVVGAGVVLLTLREGGAPDLRDPRLMSQLERSTPEAPMADAAGDAERETRDPRAANERALEAPLSEGQVDQGPTPGDAAGRAAALPSRAREMRRTASGEDVPVRRADDDRFAAPPSSAPPTPAGEPAYVRKPTAASPLGAAQEKAEGAGAAREELPKQQALARDAEQAGGTKALTQALTQKTASEAKRKEDDGKPLTDVVSGLATPPGKRAPETARTLEQRAEESLALRTVRVCGVLRDASARPLAGVQVVLTDLGRATTTDAGGRFCLEALPGEHEIAAMAVGFLPWRQRLALSEVTNLDITLQAADVFGKPRAAGDVARDPLRPLGGPREVVRDEEATPPDSARARFAAAQTLANDAARAPSAPGWDAAGAAWERAASALGAHPLALDAHWGAAEARFRAWEIAPSDARAAAARRTLGTYVRLSAPGARHDQALRWTKRISP